MKEMSPVAMSPYSNRKRMYSICRKSMSSPIFKAHTAVVFYSREAVRCIKEVHPEPCLMELNVNRNNKALLFYERMGMRKLREGDFPIGNGYYMNDYIMGLDI